jgi:cell division protein YceG involved in septum cleavage
VMDDYSDPFAEDQAEEDRRRRRAEREARRRERRAQRSQQQGALADRVKGMLSGSEAGGTEGPDPRIGSAPAARSSQPEAEAGGEPPAPPPPPPSPTALGPREPPQPPPRGPRNVRRRRIAAAVIVVIVVVGIVAGAAAAIHHFSAGGSDSSSAKQAVAGPVKKVTIPEGYDRRAIAELAKKDGVSGDYMKASESFKGFDPGKYGAQDPPNLEGFLFPATYDLPRKPNVDDLIGRQLDAFGQYMGQVNMKYAKSKNLTPYDVVTIASMIEREAVVDKDRKLIAAVIYNRLHDGMPLQIDATIRFAENNWTQPLTESDLHISSPYNTYENTGLPPTPIGNPGLASLEAAAHPASVNYLYYVAKPNGCGHFFTASYSAFQAAQDRYNSAREAAGGNSPTNCP